MLKNMLPRCIGLSLVLLVLMTYPVAAAEGSSLNSGDTAFLIICTGLVMLMTPGLALFYGGMVKRKNVLSILMQCFVIMALVSVQWIMIGYTLSFGSDISGIIGGLDWLGFKNVVFNSDNAYVGTVPHSVFALFQLMFAIITAAIITGSFAERMRFSAFIIFIFSWTTLVYDPLAHWVWGGGFLSKLGALDFAGGMVVHISSGVSGLITALVLGKRREENPGPIVSHNLPMTVLGTALLWFGWFGFNAGSALKADEIAGLALLTTNTAAAAASLSWIIIEWIRQGKPTVLGAASGAVAGMVAITPAAGFVSPLSALIIGLLVSPLCYFAVSRLKTYLGYDDALDAFGIHGIGGTFGALATGIFASKRVNPAGVDGILYGGVHLFRAELIGIIVTYLYAAFMTWLILNVLKGLIPLRVSREEEEAGLDVSVHGENAYNM
ncbi:ammonium transporter [Thermosyntropha sp.]|uniref:ammonium transporter n=1 Tax=Thermosyntropha sp. TaxID=2740820 RepID=UPI0025ECA108|nr:ammonium transporter [Thermosyntropha sp.]